MGEIALSCALLVSPWISPKLTKPQQRWLAVPLSSVEQAVRVGCCEPLLGVVAYLQLRRTFRAPSG